MRRRALPLLATVALGLFLLLLSEKEGGRAREPAPRADAPTRAPNEVQAAAPAEEREDDAATTIAGRTVDRAGNPFAVAQVRLLPGFDPDTWRDTLPSPEPLSSITTGSTGAFSFTARSDRPWLVVADAQGCLPALATVRTGTADATLVLTLVPGESCRLRAVDKDRKPLADAEALVFGKGQTLRTTAKADALGRIDVTFSPRDLVVLRAPGFTWELLEPPLDDPEVVLDREYRIGGVVVNADGSPAAGVTVSLDRYLWREETVTKEDGRFLAGGLGAGEIELTVTPPPERDARVLTVQPGDERIRIVLPTATVEGVVVLPDGRPAAGADVSANRRGTCADEAGRFALHEVDPGPTEVSASLRDGSRGSVTLTVGATAIRGVRVTLAAPDPASSRTLVRISVIDPDGRPIPSQGEIFLSGRYECRWDLDEPEGAIAVASPVGTEVIVFARERGDGTSALRASGSARTVTGASPDAAPALIRLERPVVVNLVCREEDGGAWQEDPGVETRLAISGLRSEEIGHVAGRYALRFLAGDPREGSLSILAKGHAPLVLSPWKPPTKGGEVEIRVPRAVAITGHIVDPDPTSPEYAQVEILGRCSYQGHERGTFRFDVAPCDSLHLIARKGPVPGFVKSIVVPAKGVLDLGEVLLDPPWTLKGVVVDESGATVGGAVVTVRGPGYEGKAPTRGDGTFDLLSPPSDLYELGAEKENLWADGLRPSRFLRGAEVIRLRPYEPKPQPRER